MDRSKKIEIFIVDDEALVRAALTKLLSPVPNFKIIGEADCGKKALKQIRELNPSIVLLDLKLPDISGVHVAHKLLRHNPKQKIIILTSVNKTLFLHHLVKIGVYGYLLKDTPTEELINSIRAVANNERVINHLLASELTFSRHNKQQDNILVNLNQRELEITMMLTRGMIVSQIANILNLSTKTINTYRYNIFDKLNIKNDVQLTLLLHKHKAIEVEHIYTN